MTQIGFIMDGFWNTDTVIKLNLIKINSLELKIDTIDFSRVTSNQINCFIIYEELFSKTL